MACAAVNQEISYLHADNGWHLLLSTISKAE